MSSKVIFHFDGDNAAFVVSGTATTKDLTLGAEEGRVLTGSQSAELSVTAGAGNQSGRLGVHMPSVVPAGKLRTFYRFALVDTIDDLYDLLFYIYIYDGTNQNGTAVRFNSNFGGNQEVQLLVEPGTYDTVTTTFPWALIRGGGIWNELEVEIDLATYKYSYLRLNSVYSYAPSDTVIDQTADTDPKSIWYFVDLYCTTTNRKVYLDEMKATLFSG